MVVREGDLLPELVFSARCAGGGDLFLGCPVSFELKKDAGAADQMTVVFHGESPWENLLELEAQRDGKLFFQGIVDEMIYSSAAQTVTLIARSRSALLLDNEVMPQTIRSASLALLHRQFLAPLGFSVRSGDMSRESGELTVKRGTSVLAMLTEFCQSVLGCTPVVRPDGTVICERGYRGENIPIDWEETEKVELRWNNHRILSEAVYPDSDTGMYSTVFKNPTDGGIPRVKYLKQGESMEFSPRLEVRVTLPRLFDGEPGDVAGLGWYSGTVESVRLNRDSGGDRAEVRFLAEEDE